jgi:hypothetical protein
MATYGNIYCAVQAWRKLQTRGKNYVLKVLFTLSDNGMPNVKLQTSVGLLSFTDTSAAS